MTQSLHPKKTLVEAQLGLYIAVGPAAGVDELTNPDRHNQGYQELSKLFRDRGLQELGRTDPGVSESFRFVPFELADCEWDGQELDGQAVYTVWFISRTAIDLADATKLRDMVLQAYQSVCGEYARIVHAEVYQKWTYSERTAISL